MASASTRSSSEKTIYEAQVIIASETSLSDRHDDDDDDENDDDEDHELSDEEKHSQSLPINTFYEDYLEDPLILLTSQTNDLLHGISGNWKAIEDSKETKTSREQFIKDCIAEYSEGQTVHELSCAGFKIQRYIKNDNTLVEDMKCGCKKVIIDATYFAKIMKKTTKLLHCSIEELHGILIYPQNDDRALQVRRYADELHARSVQVA